MKFAKRNWQAFSEVQFFRDFQSHENEIQGRQQAAGGRRRAAAGR